MLVLCFFVHNHPSGDPGASEDNVKLTKKLAEAGEIMGADILEHILNIFYSYLFNFNIFFQSCFF